MELFPRRGLEGYRLLVLRPNRSKGVVEPCEEAGDGIWLGDDPDWKVQEP